jgi:hypothetical protein
MTTMKCPDCGARDFYAKDPDDQYNLTEFTLQEGKIRYLEDKQESERVNVGDETEVFCDRCAWHDKFSTLAGGGRTS